MESREKLHQRAGYYAWQEGPARPDRNYFASQDAIAEQERSEAVRHYRALYAYLQKQAGSPIVRMDTTLREVCKRLDA